MIKVKWSRYRSGMAQRVGRGLALLFHDRGTRRGWVDSSTPRPHFTLWKDPVPILQKAGWAPGSVWTGGKSRPHRDSTPDRPARSSVAILAELSGPHVYVYTYRIIHKSLRDFQIRLRNIQDRHGRKEHINRERERERHSKFLSYLTGARYVQPWWRGRCQSCNQVPATRVATFGGR